MNDDDGGGPFETENEDDVVGEIAMETESDANVSLNFEEKTELANSDEHDEEEEKEDEINSLLFLVNKKIMEKTSR